MQQVVELMYSLKMRRIITDKGRLWPTMHHCRCVVTTAGVVTAAGVAAASRITGKRNDHRGPLCEVKIV